MISRNIRDSIALDFVASAWACSWFNLLLVQALGVLPGTTGAFLVTDRVIAIYCFGAQ